MAGPPAAALAGGARRCRTIRARLAGGPVSRGRSAPAGCSDAPRQELGRAGERLALEAAGYEILACNYRAPRGEVDLVARASDATVAFVEVRTRRGRRLGTPEELLTRRKQQHLVAAAEHFLAAHRFEDVAWRIDLVAVEMDAAGHLLRVDHRQDVVRGETLG